MHDLSVKDRYNLHFALGKAYDDIQNYEKAIVNFKKQTDYTESKTHLKYLKPMIYFTMPNLVIN